MHVGRQRYTVIWPYTVCRRNTKTKISRTHTRTFFGGGMYPWWELETRFARINRKKSSCKCSTTYYTYMLALANSDYFNLRCRALLGTNARALMLCAGLIALCCACGRCSTTCYFSSTLHTNWVFLWFEHKEKGGAKITCVCLVPSAYDASANNDSDRSPKLDENWLLPNAESSMLQENNPNAACTN